MICKEDAERRGHRLPKMRKSQPDHAMGLDAAQQISTNIHKNSQHKYIYLPNLKYLQLDYAHIKAAKGSINYERNNNFLQSVPKKRLHRKSPYLIK